jgi:hypothetical protein
MLIFKQLVVICLVLSSVQGDSVAESRELQAFRLAIALTEGGGQVKYEQTSQDGAEGAYQIMPEYWDWYSSNAGYPGADINDPRVQDAVARYWFNRNYNDLGSWELAAVAWFAGRKTAFEGKKNGFDSIKDIKDSTGTTIEQYVNKDMEYYREQLQLYAKVDKDVAALGLPQDDASYYKGDFDPSQVVSKEAAGLLDALTNAMSDNGRKKFPMNTKAQFQSQVPKQAGMYEDAKLITQVRRDL